MIAVYMFCGLALVAWSGCCFVYGQIWEKKRQMREDYNQRDAWAERYTKGAA